MRPMSHSLSILALVAASSALAQSNSRPDAATIVAALQARAQTPQASQPQPHTPPAWTPPPSQPFHKNSFNNLGIGSTGRGNFITPHRSVDEIPGYIFNPTTGQPVTPSPGPITIQPYPYPVSPQPYYPYSTYPYSTYRPYYNYDYGNGFYVNGRYRGDNWNINFNLGTGLMPSMYDFGGLLPIRVGNYEYSINPYTGTYVVTTAQNRGDGQEARPRTVEAPAMPQAPTRELTTLEKGRLALRENEPERAVKELRAHLRKDASDAQAMRLLAIALFESGSLDDGSAVLRQAYRMSPDLVDEAWSPSELGMSNQRVREMLSEVVQYAHKTNTASAWLSVVSIMQAEERTGLAKQMLGRAVHAGLDRETHLAFERALR